MTRVRTLPEFAVHRAGQGLQTGNGQATYLKIQDRNLLDQKGFEAASRPEFAVQPGIRGLRLQGSSRVSRV